ncbi:hypothetical protein E2I00_014980, partial [Balaenoptera physalus]
EIVAHASNVSSLVLGKASGRLLATGGDDCRVNLWYACISHGNMVLANADGITTGHSVASAVRGVTDTTDFRFQPPLQKAGKPLPENVAGSSRGGRLWGSARSRGARDPDFRAIAGGLFAQSAEAATLSSQSLTGHTSPVESVRLNTPEELIVAGSQSGSIRVWDLEAAKILRTLMGHKANICSLDFHPYGEFVASGSQDTNIKVSHHSAPWLSRRAKQRDRDGVSRLQWGLWDIRRKGCVFRYRGHSQAVRCLRFSPDGKWLASAADDHTVKLWDLTAGKMMSEFPGHTGPVNVVEFHPNEYLLASGSSDRTIRFWDLEKFQVVSCIEGEPGPVRSVLFNPDGCCLYSGCQDSLRVYGWEPERCFDVVLVNWGKNSESERRSPSSEDDRDERESRAEIQNAEDYNEIFQPKNSISEAWALPSEPQRSPL